MEINTWKETLIESLLAGYLIPRSRKSPPPVGGLLNLHCHHMTLSRQGSTCLRWLWCHHKMLQTRQLKTSNHCYLMVPQAGTLKAKLRAGLLLLLEVASFP